jgi:hypothetical protein
MSADVPRGYGVSIMDRRTHAEATHNHGYDATDVKVTDPSRAADRFVGMIVGAVIASLAGLAVAEVNDDTSDARPSFPCAEDEVLGYDASFGPDVVGCIHVEDNTLER